MVQTSEYKFLIDDNDTLIFQSTRIFTVTEFIKHIFENEFEDELKKQTQAQPNHKV